MFLNNYSARLSARNREWWLKRIDDVRAMRAAGVSVREIGIKYGVRETAVYSALRRFK